MKNKVFKCFGAETFIKVTRLLIKMRLQKQLSNRIGKKEYPKYVIIVPPKVIDELKWKEGQELEVEIKDKKLVVKKKSDGKD